MRHSKRDKNNNKIPVIDNIGDINTKLFPKGFKAKVLSKDPYIVKLRRFLNTEEIETLMKLGKNKFERSTIIVDGETTYSKTRTSDTAFLTDNGHYEEYSEPIDNILKKICYLTGCNRNQIESLMIVKYDVGEEYYNHHDYFESVDLEAFGDESQRIGTFFCYLNSLDEGDGGETEFPLIDVKVKPSKGTAVFWWNVGVDGKPLEKTLHRGNPVKKGIKYGANIWCRSSEF